MTDVRQWIAPGCVNLLGGPLDANGGPVLPIAVDRHLTLKARLRDDDAVRVWTSLDGRQSAEFTVAVQPGEVTGWAERIAGVVRSLAEAGHPLRGADLVIGGDLPAGAGLSSSAAVEGVVLLAFNDLLDLGLDRAGLVAVAGGTTDPLAIFNGVAAQALFLDASKEPAIADPVEADWVAAGLSLAVIATGQGVTDGRSAERGDECRRAADALGLDRLAAAGPDAVLKLEDEALKARTRHVITETARVRGAVRALRTGNWTQFGSMLTASHASMRDDFAASAMELDIAVEAALEAGALGARLTGFGGSVIALIETTALSAMAERVNARFAFHQFAAPTLFTVTAADGAREVTP